MAIGQRVLPTCSKVSKGIIPASREASVSTGAKAGSLVWDQRPIVPRPLCDIFWA